MTKNQDWSEYTKELIDNLPPVWTRGLLKILCLIVSIILPWSLLYKVDETGTAKGRIEPKEKPIKLDMAAAGTVAKILIREGDSVKKGQNILLLDSELVTSELHEVQDKLEGQLNRLSQLKSAKKQLIVSSVTQEQQNKAQQSEKLTQIDQVKYNINTLINSYEFQKVERLAQINQARLALASSLDATRLAKSSWESSQREIKRYKDLQRKGAVAETNVVDKEDIAKDRQRLYLQAKSDSQQAKLHLTELESSSQRSLRQAKAEIEQSKLQLQEQERGYQTLVHSGKLAMQKIVEQQESLETDITSLKSDIAQSQSQIESLKIQLKQRVLKAPINGIVYQLPIPKPGSVVQQGTMVAEIAPLNSELIVRAQIATNDSGFLRIGLRVKLKSDAYPFQDYGIIPGELSKISSDTIEIDTPNGKGAAYKVEVILKQNCIPTANKCILLRPGDTVTAEVVVRQRRIIDFLLDPFKKLHSGGLKL